MLRQILANITITVIFLLSANSVYASNFINTGLKADVYGTNVRFDWSAMPDASTYTLYYALPNDTGEIDINTIGTITMGTSKSLYVRQLPHGFKIFVAVLAHTSKGDQLSNIKDLVTNNVRVDNSSKICQWLNDMDVIIQLDLPEKYSYYDQPNTFPSYETGFLYKDSYGLGFRNVRLARKACNYSVGFTMEELKQGLRFPVIVYTERSSSMDFTYENEPLLMRNMEEIQALGGVIVLKINGETSAFGHYSIP